MSGGRYTTAYERFAWDSRRKPEMRYCSRRDTVPYWEPVLRINLSAAGPYSQLRLQEPYLCTYRELVGYFLLPPTRHFRQMWLGGSLFAETAYPW